MNVRTLMNGIQLGTAAEMRHSHSLGGAALNEGCCTFGGENCASQPRRRPQLRKNAQQMGNIMQVHVAVNKRASTERLVISS